MPDAVLDACAVLAYVRDEPGADLVEAQLLDAAATTFIHAVNLCEVYYDVLRADGKAMADQVVEDLLGLGIALREDMDIVFWKSMGELKAAHRVSLGDCFAIALANREACDVATSDHHEFDALVQAGVCRVRFIR